LCSSQIGSVECNTVMSLCNVCKLSVIRNSRDKIICKQCKSYFHGKCVGLGQTEIDQLVNGPGWSCKNCVKEFRIQRSNSDTTPVRVNSPPAVNGSFITLETLNTSLEDLKALIVSNNERLREDLSISIRTCTEKIERTTEMLAEQAELIQTQQVVIKNLTDENVALRTRLDAVCCQMDDLEQYSRRNTLEINGVPSLTNEDVTDTVLKVCKSVGVNISKDSIDACHRLMKRGNRPAPGIMVKFVRREDAHDLMRKRKMKGDLNTRHLGLTGETRSIYINRSLTPKRRLLFARAKQLQRDGRIKYVWTDHAGNIKVRIDDGGKAFSIKNENDLSSFSEDPSVESGLPSARA
jgi:hypothetical protein